MIGLELLPHYTVLDYRRWEGEWTPSPTTLHQRVRMAISHQLAELEVVSPSTCGKDERLKFELYQREGVKYCILIYPD
ncbi:MAG: Uma2 family endonuclease [Methylohalobius sp.]|nr:Uma2 family endonuclease [Methylohalobius sp.]